MGNQRLLNFTECRLWNGNRYFTQGFGTFVVAQHVGEDGYCPDMLRFISLLTDRGCFVASLHLRAFDNTQHDFGSRHTSFFHWIHYLREKHGLGKPRLFAYCRGGLQLLNFWCSYPEEAEVCACLSPVTDPYVYPKTIQRLVDAYGVKDFGGIYKGFCPNERAGVLSGKDIRIWHNPKDDFIPKKKTTDVFASKCGAVVTNMESIGHNWNHEYDNEMADFLTYESRTG